MLNDVTGWIKLHKKILDWEWYDDINTTRVFIHLLLTVNWENGEWRGRVINRGQRGISLSKLAKECHLTRQALRTTLSHLKSTNDLTIEQHGSFSLLTVLNYNAYQEANTQINQRSTNDQTLYKNIRNKEDKNNTPTPFENFWKLYPKKTGKEYTSKVWERLTTEEQAMALSSLPAHLKLDQWTKDQGRFIPNPATWLNQKRFEDELGQEKKELDFFEKKEFVKQAVRIGKITKEETEIFTLEELYAKSLQK